MPPPESRSAKPLGVLLLIALGAVAYTAHRMDQVELELQRQRDAQVQRDQEHRDRVVQVQLQQVEQLRSLGHAAQALSLCDAILAAAPNPGDASLAAVYRARGELKQELGKPGAADDLERARRLRR